MASISPVSGKYWLTGRQASFNHAFLCSSELTTIMPNLSRQFFIYDTVASILYRKV